MGKSKNRRKKAGGGGRGRRAIVRPSPEEMRTRLAARYSEMPVGECYITEEWRNPLSLGTVCFTRKLPGGARVAAIFLVDLACLGVKDVFVRRFQSGELAGYIDGYFNRFVPCEPALGVKVVTSAVAYARDIGFDPPPEYEDTSAIFVGIDPASCTEEVVLGVDGKPLYIEGPHDDAEAILAKLAEWEAKHPKPLIVTPEDAGKGLVVPPGRGGGLIVVPK
jgi:hypothetical protein